MRNDYVIKKMSRSYLVVSVFSVLAATVGMIVDSVVTGNCLGSEALAALSIVSPVFLLFVMLGTILATGSSIQCAEAIGKDQHGRVNNIFSLTLLVTAILSILLTGAGILLRSRLVVWLGARGALLSLAEDYILGLALGALPIMLAIVIMDAIRTDNSRRLSLLAILVMTAVNISLDLLFVLVFRLGLFGMALATSISYAVAVLVSCLHFRRPHNTLRLVNIRDLTSELARITKTGLPEALSRLVGLLRALILNNLLIVIGGVGAVTVFSVRSNANYIVGAITLGVGHSIIPLVGVFFGEEDRRVLKDVLVTTLKTGFVINAAAALLLALLAGEFSALFGVSDHATVAASSEAVRLFALSMPLMMLNLTMMNFYQSTKNLLLANVICLGEGFLLVIGLTFLLQGFMGVSSVWLAFFLAEFFMILVILLLIRRKSGRWPKSMDDCLLLPTDFGGKPEDILDLSIGNSLADVVTIARQVGPFCTAHGIEDRRSYLLSLGIEEMAGNVVRHSFKPGVRQFLDIRILIKGERLILRVRDNGSRFDPFAYLAKQDPADICSNIGIRLIQRLAVKVDYRYTVGLNNLIITI